MNIKTIVHSFNLLIFSTQESVPPVMAFHMGSLGFLTPFEFDDFQQQINNVLKGWNMNL